MQRCLAVLAAAWGASLRAEDALGVHGPLAEAHGYQLSASRGARAPEGATSLRTRTAPRLKDTGDDEPRQLMANQPQTDPDEPAHAPELKMKQDTLHIAYERAAKAAASLNPKAARAAAIAAAHKLHKQAQRQVQAQDWTAAGRAVLADSRNAAAACPTGRAALTHLESNSWLLTLGGATILLDPVLEGHLDPRNLPVVGDAAAREALPPRGLSAGLPPLNGLVLTQDGPGHAHIPTLAWLQTHGKLEGVPILAPISAAEALEVAGIDLKQVQFIEPGQQGLLKTRRASVRVVATTGYHGRSGPALPWQQKRQQNGYIFRPQGLAADFPSVYFEPSNSFVPDELEKQGAVDVVIAPVESKFVSFDGDDAVRVASAVSALRPSTVLSVLDAEDSIDHHSTHGSYLPEAQVAHDLLAREALAKQPHVARAIPGVPLWLGRGGVVTEAPEGCRSAAVEG